MIKLKRIIAKQTNRNVKCTIHKSGTLGFSKEAANKLKLSPGQYLSFSINEDDTNENNLYVEILNEEIEGSIRISKAGNYFYAKTKLLFDELDVNYKENTVIYDIIDFDYENKKMYKFLRRDLKRKKKLNNVENSEN